MEVNNKSTLEQYVSARAKGSFSCRLRLETFGEICYKLGRVFTSRAFSRSAVDNKRFLVSSCCDQSRAGRL